MTKDRKADHIELALAAQVAGSKPDRRFIYEPLLSAHPENTDTSISFLGKRMMFPLWISSMTGGTAAAHRINNNLARACHEFGLGMGLGSCRRILSDDTYLSDFDWRDALGDDRPFYANLGIAQIEQLLLENKHDAIKKMLERLRTDGLIVHVNPLQEWFQPEGDRLKKAPVDTIEQLLSVATYPIIVKEVGQGMGPESLRRLLQLPLAAIEFAAYGGTNFSKLELSRTIGNEAFEPFIHIGQTANQMVLDVNQLLASGIKIECRQLIISGGIQHALDGYYLTGLSKLPSVFGMASKLLKPASESYQALEMFLQEQINQYQLARAFLKINSDDSE